MRDLEQPDKPSHISYKEYKHKVVNDPNKGLVLFISAFFVLLLVFLGIARQLSPDVDVAIGDDSISAEEMAKRSVDDRLKLIQMDDNAQDVKDEIFTPELEEKVSVPKDLKKQEETLADEPVVLDTGKNLHQPAVQTPQPALPAAQPVNAKVIVGYYATPQQAEVAKGILLDSGLNVTPFIKNIGGAYTLQIGSFNSREKAQSVANDLLKNNFPARVIVE